MKTSEWIQGLLDAIIHPDFKEMMQAASDCMDLVYGQGPYMDEIDMHNAPFAPDTDDEVDDKVLKYQREVDEEMLKHSGQGVSDYLSYAWQYFTLSAKWLHEGPRKVLQDLIDEGERTGAHCVRFAAGPHTDAVLFMPTADAGNSMATSVTRTLFHHKRGEYKEPTDNLRISSVEDNSDVNSAVLSDHSRELDILRAYIYDNLLTTGDYKLWKSHLKIMHEHFGRTAVNNSANLMQQVIRRELQRISAKGTINAEDFALVASRTIPRAILGECVEPLLYSDEWVEHAKVLREISNNISDIMVFKQGKHGYHILADKIGEDRQRLTVVAEKIIALSEKSARAKFARKDFDRKTTEGGQIEKMFFKNFTSKKGVKYSREDLLGMTLLVLIVGVNTVTSATKEMLLQLVDHPDWKDKIKAELLHNVELLRTQSLDLDFSNDSPGLGEIIHALRDYRPRASLDLPGVGLNYAEAFLHEVYRMEPPVPLVTRRNPIDFVEKGVYVRASTGAFLPLFALNRSPVTFGDDAKTFNPGRFLRKESENLNRPFTHKVKVFGVPPHPCKGEKFARMYGLLVLEELCLNYKLSAHNKYQNEETRRELGAFIRYQPDPQFVMERVDTALDISGIKSKSADAVEDKVKTKEKEAIAELVKSTETSKSSMPAKLTMINNEEDQGPKAEVKEEEISQQALKEKKSKDEEALPLRPSAPKMG